MDVALDDDIGLAEPEHLETMFDALIDTVSGNESLSLTGAQQYAMSVLGSSGAATRAEMITGVEGFFSKIGDGVQKTWEYIKKMFQSIWNWFFGKKEKGQSITEHTEAALKANEASLQSWARADAQNNEVMKAQMKTLEDLLDSIKTSTTSSSEKAEAEKAIDSLRLEYSNSSHDKVNGKVVKDAIEIVIKLHSRAHRALEETSSRAVEEYNGYMKLLHEDHSSKFAGTQFESVYKDYRAVFTSNLDTKITGYLKIPKITTLSIAQRVTGDLIKALQELDGERGALSTGFKADAISRIKKLEEQVKRPDMGAENRAKFQRDLTACKLFLSLTTQVIKRIERTCNTIKGLSKMIMRLCGLRTA